jgi:Transposase
MRKKRFTVEQMIGVPKQAEVGVPVAEVIRKAGISEQTFYRWKAKYAGLEVDQVRQMAQFPPLVPWMSVWSSFGFRTHSPSPRR